MENYYEILQVKNFAEIEVIKASYRALSKKYHPDINKEVNENVMIKINLAYEVLNDDIKKQKYDQELREFLKKSDNLKKESRYTVFDEQEKKEDSLSKKSKTVSFVSGVISSLASTYITKAQEIKKEVDNAYYLGSSMTDEQLIRNYLKSKGYRRTGLSKVLEERSLLYREGDTLVPSYTFNQIVKRYR